MDIRLEIIAIATLLRKCVELITKKKIQQHFGIHMYVCISDRTTKEHGSDLGSEGLLSYAPMTIKKAICGGERVLQKYK